MTIIVPLTNAEVEAAQDKAAKRFKERLGERPTLKSIRQHYTPEVSLTSVHYLAMVLALLMFVVTLSKIWEHQSILVSEAYSQYEAAADALSGSKGFVISRDLAIKINQISFSFASEIALIIFLIWFNITPRRPLRRQGQDGISFIPFMFQFFPLLAAVAATGYILYVNTQTGGLWLTNIIPPLFTFTVSFLFEDALSRRMKTDQELRRVLKPRQQVWDNRLKNMESDAEYLRALFVELTNALITVRRRVDGKWVHPNAHLKDGQQDAVIAAVREQINRINQIALAATEDAQKLQGAIAADEQGKRYNGDGKVLPPDGSWTPVSLAEQITADGNQHMTVQQAQQVYARVSRSTADYPQFWKDVRAILDRRT